MTSFHVTIARYRRCLSTSDRRRCRHTRRVQSFDATCAFGNFMFDLAIAMSDMKPRLHRSFLDGYQAVRDLPDGHERLIEGLFVGGMVGMFSYWVANPDMQEALVERVPGIAQKYAARYNRDEPFWFS